MVRKKCWYDFNFLTLTKAHFAAQLVVSPGEYSMCTWQEYVLCCFGMECCINIKSTWSKVSFKGLCFLIDFLSGWSVCWWKCGVKFPHCYWVTVDFSPYDCYDLPDVSKCSYVRCICIFTVVISSSWIDPLIIM